MDSSDQRPKQRRIRILVAAAVLLALAAYERWLRPAGLERRLPTGSAEWVWSTAAEPGGGWVNFFVYKDFELAGAVPDAAELMIQADEGYWLFLNGKALGSGSYRDDEPLDTYEVGRFLRGAANRIVVQLRSRRGAGGLLLSLDLGARGARGARGAIVTDATWRSTSRYEAALLSAGFVAEDEAPVQVWGAPPVGDWGEPIAKTMRPVLDRHLIAGPARASARIRLLGRSDWERHFPEAERRIPLGRWVVFDMGEVAEGYLNVVFSSRGGARGLVYTGIERIHGPDSAEPATWFLAPPGRGSWSDLEPRRFRFAAVLADAEIAGLRLFETSLEGVGSRSEAGGRSVKAFGLEPPSGTTVEDEFWRELERVTGLTGREALKSFPGG
ncbi:MAG: hypothetical protein ACE5GX_11345 [Thermoanaerobaculia bacterium]